MSGALFRHSNAPSMAAFRTEKMEYSVHNPAQLRLHHGYAERSWPPTRSCTMRRYGSKTSSEEDGWHDCDDSAPDNTNIGVTVNTRCEWLLPTAVPVAERLDERHTTARKSTNVDEDPTKHIGTQHFEALDTDSCDEKSESGGMSADGTTPSSRSQKQPAAMIGGLSSTTHRVPVAGRRSTRREASRVTPTVLTDGAALPSSLKPTTDTACTVEIDAEAYLMWDMDGSDNTVDALPTERNAAGTRDMDATRIGVAVVARTDPSLSYRRVNSSFSNFYALCMNSSEELDDLLCDGDSAGAAGDDRHLYTTDVHAGTLMQGPIHDDAVMTSTTRLAEHVDAARVTGLGRQRTRHHSNQPLHLLGGHSNGNTLHRLTADEEDHIGFGDVYGSLLSFTWETPPTPQFGRRQGHAPAPVLCSPSVARARHSAKKVSLPPPLSPHLLRQVAA